MNAQTGELFLIREIDLEKLQNPTLSLQIQASQVDNPFRQALARVDISVQDINDNSPEVSAVHSIFDSCIRASNSQVSSVCALSSSSRTRTNHWLQWDARLVLDSLGANVLAS